MESILIWFATGFSFAFGCAFGFFCFKHRPSKNDKDSLNLIAERNGLDRDKVQLLERIVAVMEQHGRL